MESVLSNLLHQLSLCNKSFVVMSTAFTVSVPEVHFILRNHFLCSPIGFPGSSASKESAYDAGNAGDAGSIPGLGRFPWRREWQPTPLFLPGEHHGQRSLVGYSPWGHKELDITERLTHFKVPILILVFLLFVPHLKLLLPPCESFKVIQEGWN